ncbi:uncharacterized protein LOC124540948 [Vanessa cardui]|uniref:uncharacterized protein LOC124540948 n=1 Tax=Vanessa cardui TaxID=171605 RepID=UPI001F13BA5F|nr:uncharacterized protein LOC124540948 [Vanessa cardui]
MNINELVFDLDELDLVINDINNIYDAYEKPGNIEDYDKNEFIKLDKLNNILKEFNKKHTSVTENKLFIPLELNIDATESFTSKDNLKDLKSLLEFRKTKPINNNEILYDFEKYIKINEIFISNNIDSTEGSAIKTDENNNINSVQEISGAVNEGNLNNTTPFVDNDIISISSDEDIKSIIEIDYSESNDSDCSDYHSSDFEFIDEDEAKRAGLIINNRNKEITVEIETQNYQDLIIHDYFHSPVASDNHVVPEGVDYINLFGGNYTPLPTVCVQNKAISAGTSMNAGVDGIGFDMRMLQDNPELDACLSMDTVDPLLTILIKNKEIIVTDIWYSVVFAPKSNLTILKNDVTNKYFFLYIDKDEAHESEQKILKLYPIENRRKRSRRY